MYIEREINDTFRKVNSIYSAIALVGPRQAGKTTFLKEHMKHLHSSYVLFDDPDARALFEEDIKKFEKQYCHTSLEEYQLSDYFSSLCANF